MRVGMRERSDERKRPEVCEEAREERASIEGYKYWVRGLGYRSKRRAAFTCRMVPGQICDGRMRTMVAKCAERGRRVQALGTAGSSTAWEG
jgi:hypothetical protein